MIRIDISKNDNKYALITFKGHANYSEFGKDIVCAAVSSTMLCTINAIYLIKEDSIKVTKNDNDFTIEVVKYDDITNKLIDNMINCLKSLEREYPKNIKIK